MKSPRYGLLSYRLRCLIPVILSLALILLCLTALFAAGQAVQDAAGQPKPAGPHNLAEFLAQMPWNSGQQGALLAVDPESALRDEAAVTDPVRQFTSLRAALPVFHRMLFPVSSLTVIAPTEMVQIEDKPNQPPNFYDGLPRDLKVKYLLSILTADQWMKLNRDGLGVGDLMGEQRTVFLSLLPDPFRYLRIRLGNDGIVIAPRQTIALSPEERQQVRLRVYHRAELMIPTQSGALSIHPSEDRPGKPNGFRLVRDKDADSAALYAVSFRSILPNKPKPGQLNYASHALDASVSLRDAQTVQDLMDRAAEATHLELHADLRVGELPVLVSGDHTRAGDLLQALALAVTGAYRKMDRAYVLVGELVGSGPRQWRVAAWAAEMQMKVERWNKEVTQKIARSRSVDLFDFSPNDAYSLTGQQIAAIEKRRKETNDYFTPTELLSLALQQYVQTTAEHDNATRPADQHLRDDQVRIDINLKYAFQPPHDDLLDSEGGLGDLGIPRSGDEPAKEEPIPAPPPAGPIPPATQRFLLLTPQNLDDVQRAIAEARNLGFTDLVLHTESREQLAAAVQAASRPDGALRISIYAAVAPFAAADAPQNEGGAAYLPDRNLNGETATEAAASRRQSPLWPEFTKIAGEHTWYPERALGIDSAIAPVEPALTPRFQRLAALAKIQGLSGLLLYDTQPPGYAGKHEDNLTGGNIQPLFLHQQNLGFTPAFRLEFLRRERVDPIDLPLYGMYGDTDLSLPFFPDGGTPRETKARFGTRNAPPAFGGVGAKWDRFLAEKNRAAMADLYSALRAANPMLPLYIQVRPEWNTDLQDVHYSRDYVEWIAPDQLPTVSLVRQDNGARQLVKGARQITLLDVSPMSLIPFRDTLRRQLLFLRRDRDKPDAPGIIGIDLHTIPLDRALILLNQCITPAKDAAAAIGATGK